MFTCECMHHGEINHQSSSLTIPEPAGGENFPIDSPNFTNIAQLRKVAKKVIATVEEALPTMDGETKEYFQLLLEDARLEGLNMPVMGPIPLD